MIRLFLNVCKTFHKMKHLNFNDYDLYLHLSAESTADSFTCPSCKAPDEMFVHNGSYRRHLVFMDKDHVQDRLIEIKDFKCISCNRTHALLYSLIIPHSSYSISFIISLIYSRLTGRFTNIRQLCEFYDISERTFYRIWERLLIDCRRMNTLLNTYSDLLKTVSSLFHSEDTIFHSILETFFKSCGYSFMQPHITFRQRIFIRGSSPGCIR